MTGPERRPVKVKHNKLELIMPWPYLVSIINYAKSRRLKGSILQLDIFRIDLKFNLFVSRIVFIPQATTNINVPVVHGWRAREQ